MENRKQNEDLRCR